MTDGEESEEPWPILSLFQSKEKSGRTLEISWIAFLQ